MSRSFRKTEKNKFGWSSSTRMSEKEWKQSYNRRMRRKTTMITNSLDVEYIEDANFPDRKVIGNAWCSPSDGPKSYFGDLNSDRIQWNCYWTPIRSTMEWYRVTNDNLKDAIKFFNWTKSKIENVKWDIEYFGSHSWYKVKDWKLLETMEERIKENKKNYAKMMRK